MWLQATAQIAETIDLQLMVAICCAGYCAPLLRPHRGISQELLPIYLGFFDFVHNVRKCGKAILASLLALLLN